MNLVDYITNSIELRFNRFVANSKSFDYTLTTRREPIYGLNDSSYSYQRAMETLCFLKIKTFYDIDFLEDELSNVFHNHEYYTIDLKKIRLNVCGVSYVKITKKAVSITCKIKDYIILEE